MKPKELLSLFFFLPICLTSCQKEGAGHILYPLKNIDVEEKTYDIIDGETVKVMAEGKADFLLFVGKEHCSICESAKSKISSFLYDRKLKIFEYDYVEDEVSTSLSLFADLKATPTLMAVKNGAVLYQINVDDFDNENTLTRFFKNYPVTSLIETFYFTDTLKEYLFSRTSFLFFTYYPNDPYIYADYLTLSAKANLSTHPTLFIENSFLENKEEVYQQMGIDGYESEYLIGIYEEGQIKTISSYLSDSDGFDIIISTYYQ